MHDGGRDPLTGGQLDPLLRELLDFEVVELDPSDGSWRLTDVARERLGRLAAPPPPTEKIVFFGHRCAWCGEARPTRLRAGGYQCDACAGRAPVPVAPVGPVRQVAADGMKPVARDGTAPVAADGMRPVVTDRTAPGLIA